MKKLICIACGIFRKDLDHIQKSLSIKMEYIFLDSMLHMKPEKLSQSMNKIVDSNSNNNIILLYGDCHPGMYELEQKQNIYRIPGINCINISMANNKYKKLRKEGAFILMEEWIHRWKEVFQVELGFKSKERATEFMQEMHKKIVYLDNDNEPIPYNTLEEISDYTGLPYIIEKNDPNVLEEEIIRAVKYFENEK